MTRAACDLILRISTLGLAWRTVKALKRNGSYKHTQSNADGHHIEIDWEILQLWALYAFHVLYVYSGLEWFASFLPLYYYFKMILLVITFLIPNTKFANFWFELVLVPMMQRIHGLLNFDWKGFIRKESFLLPWQFLDLFILPGLISDEEAKAVMKLRQQQLEKALNSTHSFSVVENAATGKEATIDAMDLENDDAKLRNENILNVETSAPSPSNSNEPVTRSPDTPRRTRLRPSTAPSPQSSSFTSPVARSRVAASSLHLRKFSQDHNISSRTDLRPTPESPQRRTKSIPAPDQATPKASITTRKSRKPLAADPSTKTSAWPRRKQSSNRPPSVAFKQTKTSLLSQTSKSPKRPVKSSSRLNPETRSQRDKNILYFDDDDTVSISSRRSMGNSVRKFITGDDNIRIRDFLFDLELPSIPSPKRVSDADDMSVRSARSVRSVKSDIYPYSKSRRSARATINEDRRTSLDEWRKERDSRLKEHRSEESSSRTSSSGRPRTSSRSGAALTKSGGASQPSSERNIGTKVKIGSRRSARLASNMDASN